MILALQEIQDLLEILALQVIQALLERLVPQEMLVSQVIQALQGKESQVILALQEIQGLQVTLALQGYRASLAVQDLQDQPALPRIPAQQVQPALEHKVFLEISVPQVLQEVMGRLQIREQLVRLGQVALLEIQVR